MKYFIPIILFILILFNITFSIRNYTILERNSRVLYEAMVCVDDPDCTLELDILEY